MSTTISLILGLVIGAGAFYVYLTMQKKQSGATADGIIGAAEKEAHDIRRKANHDAEKIMDDARKQANEDRDRAAEIEKKALS